MDEPWLETLDLNACLERMRTQRVGRLAVVVDGTPIVLPVSYRLVEASGLTWVALRTRPGNPLTGPLPAEGARRPARAHRS